jgi:hypothetical protein
MAGEWIAMDVGLPDKPEVQELIDLTGEPVEVVVFRIYRLWSWAAIHCSDGVAKMTPPRLVRTCGGSLEFWAAVAAVGWLEIDQTAATVAVPGWDRRFSQAAKSRAQQRDRAAAQEEERGRLRSRAGAPCAQAQAQPAPQRRRGEEIEEIRISSSSSPPGDDAWEEFRKAWNASGGKPWTPATPPTGWHERIAEDGWFDLARQALGRVKQCRYFSTPMTLIQLVKPGWAEKVVGGSFDEPKSPGRQRASGGDEKAPPRVFVGRDADRFAATIAKTLTVSEKT